MSDFPKPRVVVSKCIEFASCRWNGAAISSPVVRKLMTFLEFLPVCPEVEIGLGIPRDPIRVVSRDGMRTLVQPATVRDVTAEMKRFTGAFLGEAVGVDGFILKSRSPSCGIKDVNIYAGPEKGGAIGRGVGFFGGAVLERFPDLPVEDEGRLSNFTLREHFLTKLYTLAGFGAVRKSGSMKDLVRFHTENKYLFMAYNQRELKELGRITANPERRPFTDVLSAYEEHLFKALARPSRFTSNINVMMHALGYVSDGLEHREKAYFLDSLERYRAGRVPLSAPLGIMRSWVVRFEEPYLAEQTYFEPYPEGLVEITDSGKGRKL